MKRPNRLVLSLSVATLLVACGDDTTATEDETGSGTDSGSGEEESDDDDSSASAETSADTTADTSADGTTESGSADESSSGGPACGDGTMDPGEECDDGNTSNEDSCSADCTIPVEAAWTETYNSETDGRDQWNDLVVDAEGNIYVLGSHEGPANNADVILRQYQPDGTEGWTFTWAPTGEGETDLSDFGVALAVHPSGDFIIAATSEQETTREDIVLLRVAAAGDALVWEERLDGESTGPEEVDEQDFADDVAIDAEGNIIVLGTQRVAEQEFDMSVTRYSADGGDPLWQAFFNGEGNGTDGGDAVQVDADGVVWALGTQEISSVVDEGFFQRYLVADGAPDGEPTAIDFFPNDFVFDGDGNVVVTGVATSDTTGTNVAVAKYDPDLAQLWNFSHNGPGNAGDFGSKVAVDGDGNVYVVGSDVRIGESGNIWTGKLDPDGAAVWAIDYNSMGNDLDDIGSGIGIDADGNVIVGGYESVIGQDRDGWLTKYTQL